MRRERTPHAVAWWIWAAGLALAALRTSNPLLLALLAAAIVVVCVARTPRDLQQSPLATFARVALIIILVRVVLQIVFGQRLPGHVLFTLPSVPMPSWAEGVSIGGPVSIEGLLSAITGGLRLAVVLLAFGAANALASPRAVLRSLPGLLHEVAVAITVALCFAPEVLASVRRIQQARLLRGRPTTGIAGMRGIAVPVLEDALDRSIQLAASMGARGFGRRPVAVSLARERSALATLILGSMILLVGGYGVLAGSSVVPGAAWLAGLGLAAVCLGVGLSGRRAARTRYRPAPVGLRSVACGASGWLSALLVVIAGVADASSITWSPWPLSWPQVTPLAFAAVVIALVPLLVAPGEARVAAASGTKIAVS
ncbi:MAG: energy-coupling factor transporter transmembrane component T [Actinomycetes bacterium]